MNNILEVASGEPALVVKLKAYMKTRGLSASDVVRNIGFSRSTLSLWMAGKYQGDVSAVEAAVRQYLELCEERSRKRHMTLSLDFVPTQVSKKVFEIARNCHVGGKVGLLYGDAGLGKTRAAQEYAARNSDVILLFARRSTTMRSIVKELHCRLGLDGGGFVDDMFLEIAEKLKNSGRLVIVDEAEHLGSSVLDELRRFSDREFAGVGLLLIGLPRLFENLKGRSEHRYISGRMAWNYKVEELCPDDVKALVSSVLPAITALWKTVYRLVGGNTRRIEALMERSIQASEINALPLTDEIVEEAAKLLIL